MNVWWVLKKKLLVEIKLEKSNTEATYIYFTNYSISFLRPTIDLYETY